MTAQDAAGRRGDQEHPSPHRGKVSLLALWTGLVLAPAAWFLQLTIDTPLLSQACYPRDEPLGGPLPTLSAVVLAVDLAALVAAVVGFVIAWRTWHHTRQEKPGRGQHLMASGEGRSRFMAMAGMLTSALVGIAVVYIGLLHLLLRDCGT